MNKSALLFAAITLGFVGSPASAADRNEYEPNVSHLGWTYGPTYNRPEFFPRYSDNKDNYSIGIRFDEYPSLQLTRELRKNNYWNTGKGSIWFKFFECDIRSHQRPSITVQCSIGGDSYFQNATLPKGPGAEIRIIKEVERQVTNIEKIYADNVACHKEEENGGVFLKMWRFVSPCPDI